MSLEVRAVPDSEDDPGIFVTEIYSAIQGEAAYAGQRQVFVRLAGCNIRCAYCDQPEALVKAPGTLRCERSPGLRDWEEIASPAPLDDVAERVDRLWRALPHGAVSVTGGEPLFQSGRLAALLPLLTARGHRVHLETNGTLSAGMSRVAAWVDSVSMDVKLDSVDGEGVPLGTHVDFLDVCLLGDAPPEVVVKIVVGCDTSGDEVKEAVAMVCGYSPFIPIYLQPVTPFARVTRAPSPEHVLNLQAAALSIHPDVRVLPQTHKFLGQL